MTGRTLDSELAHFGVKGMKWGVRKRKLPGTEDIGDAVVNKVTGNQLTDSAGYKIYRTKQDDGYINSQGRRLADEAVTARMDKDKIVTTKSLDTLSNQGLQNLNQRLRLESEFSKLTATPEVKAQQEKGKSFLRDMLTDMAQRHAKDLLNDVAGRKRKAFVDDLFRDKAAERAKRAAKNNANRVVRGQVLKIQPGLK